MGLNLEEVPVPQFNGKHKLPNLVGIVALVVLFLVTCIITGAGEHMGIIQPNDAVSNKLPTFLTPASWTFMIWILIFVWLLALMIFFVVTIFLKNDFGRLYLFPEVANLPYVGAFGLCLCSVIAWTFLWDNEELTAAATLLFIVFLSSLAALVIFCYNISCDSQRMKREQENMYWVYTVLGVNGHATFTTWALVAAMINLVHALYYDGKEDLTQSSLGVLGSLMILEVIWFVLSNFVIGQYVRFILTPHAVIIWAAAGIMCAHNEKQGTLVQVPQIVQDVNLGLLILACVLFVLRLLHVTFLQIKKPLRYT